MDVVRPTAIRYELVAITLQLEHASWLGAPPAVDRRRIWARC